MVYAAVDTWDLTPDAFPYDVQVVRTAVATPEAGPLYLRRQTLSSVAPSGQAARRRWTLNFANATKAQYNRVQELWRTTTGGTQGLNYSVTSQAYSGTENVIVRMVNAPLSIQRTRHNGYAFSVTLEEMFDAP